MLQSPPRRLMVLLILLAALPLLSLNMFLPSLTEMSEDFDIGYDKMTVAVSGYLIFTAFIQLAAEPLADRFGRRPIILSALGIFGLASIGCALAPSYDIFIACRIAQGAIATGLALSRTVVGDISTPEGSASTLGYISMVMSLAPILGPSFGGLLAELFGWRSNFLFYAISSFVLWIFIWRLLPETSSKVDTNISTFLKSYIELTLSFPFWMYTAVMVCGVGGFFVFVSGIPLVAETQFKMDQVEIGILIGTVTMGFLLGSFLSGRLAAKHGPVRMIFYGRFVAFCGVFTSLCLIYIGLVAPSTVIFGALCVGLGNGLSMPSASTAVMYVKKGLGGSASGLSGAMVVLIGGVMTSVTGVAVGNHPTAMTLLVIIACLTFAGLLFACGVIYMTREKN